jgi:hypothetical protein
LLRGDFCNGATQLRFGDSRSPIENLAVHRSDLDYAIDRLQQAGVAFSQVRTKDAPRRLPRVVPL